MKHLNYDPITVDPYGEDWKVVPVDGYGNAEMIRSIVRNERPDFVWLMTDPRFWEWLWAIENEIRPLCPMVYYHVWDNYPYPMFNQKFYESNDHIACISKVSYDIVKNVAPKFHQLTFHMLSMQISLNLCLKKKEDRSEKQTFIQMM